MILPRFKERYFKSCCKVALKRYYKKDEPIILTTVGYLVLFILKKNGKLRMYINYRQLNSIIKKD